MRKNSIHILVFLLCSFSTNISFEAQVSDPELGLRADWMKGALGLLWLPERNYNGNIEGIRIDDFIAQIKNLRTIDYVQLPLTSPNIFSPIHVGPHPIIESLWQGDTDTNGDIINLAVPREAVDDPLLSWLKALRAAGLKTEIYVNSYNLLARNPDDTQTEYPDVSNRWMEWCDTNAEAQAFINSQNYHNGDGRRKYMFCYAEFILKEYSKRYGDLIDAWCFDSADNIMENECGDDPASDDVNDQRIYQAFAEACRTGNPNAALSFNNSVGDREGNPFSTATLFDDYTFGHPFGGAGNMVEPRDPLYDYNFGIIEWMEAYNGYAFRDDSRDWNDNVVSHFFPKQSTTSWNAGNTPCLTDEEFVEWTTKGLISGGAITWGTPLVRTNLENSPELVLRDYAVTQFELTDTYLKEFQSPGAPNWSRQYTILPPAYKGSLYSHKLIEGFDFWDPEGDVITSLIALGSFPSWLTIKETAPGVWTLSGTPTETVETDYNFNLQVNDVSGGTNRQVTLNVLSEFASTEVQVKATASTNYGINTKAVMYSDVQTAPDGLATYRISIDVIPTSNKAVISGVSGGDATENSWGLGDGTNNNSDDIFTGSDNEWIESIKNIQIVDFNANGGSLTVDNFSGFFKSITIVNAQSVNDFVSLKVGTTTYNPGRLANKTEILDLELETLTNNITDFAIGTGNTSTTNKWSVEGIHIAIEINDSSLSTAEINQEEIVSFALFPSPANNRISFNMPLHAVKIIDVNGKELKTFSKEIKNIDISDLMSGIYILKGINAEGKTIIKKFIKQTSK
ncbi:T9SS type A sorting domain-containing protein [Polaribacter sp. Asnod1-A03]|uniref:T9SS type A sorting domain-containing protein n=1 Tax=Polaribacter sp. Asnod1-A03 TaxID=3160581 RepID=UPI0038658B1D